MLRAVSVSMSMSICCAGEPQVLVRYVYMDRFPWCPPIFCPTCAARGSGAAGVVPARWGGQRVRACPRRLAMRLREARVCRLDVPSRVPWGPRAFSADGGVVSTWSPNSMYNKQGPPRDLHYIPSHMPESCFKCLFHSEPTKGSCSASPPTPLPRKATPELPTTSPPAPDTPPQ